MNHPLKTTLLCSAKLFLPNEAIWCGLPSASGSGSGKPRQIKSNRLGALAAFATAIISVVLLGLGNNALAQSTYTWTGNDIASYWNYNNNWSGNSAPASLTGGIILAFDGSNKLNATNNSYGAGSGLNALYFNATTGGAFNLYNTSPGAGINFYDYSGTDPNIQNNGTTYTPTINFPITNANTHVSGSVRILNIDYYNTSSQGPITFNGPISSTADGNARVLNLYNTSGNTITFNGPISDGSGSVAGSTMGLSQLGSGVTILSATNTYTGQTTISAGTLKAGSTNGLSPNSAFSVAAGATLDLGGYTNTIKSLGVDTATSLITNSTGAATLIVSSALGGTACAQLFGGNLGLQIYGGGNTLILGDANSTYSGGTIIGNGSGGATRIFGSGTIGTGSPGAVTKGNFGTGTITFGAATTDKSQFYTTGTTTINNPIVVNTALGDGSQFGAFRIESGGNLLTIGGTINANLADVMFEANNSAGQIATVTNTISGNSGLQVLAQNAGGITVTLANTGTANSYAGNTAVSSTNVSSPAATLKLGAANQIPYGAGAGNLLMTNGAFNLNGYSQTLNGLSGSGTVDGVSGTPSLTVGSNNATSTFSGAIKNTGGTLALTKAGTGTLTLSGVNTFGGATTITNGTLLAGSTNALSPNSAFSVAAGATLDLGGFTNTIKSLGVDTATSLITNSTGAATLKVATALGSTACAQLFGGNLGLQIFGGGNNTILGNANSTYSGGTLFGNSGTTGTRFLGSGTIGTGSPGAVTKGYFGTGTITIGSATTDKSQFYISGVTTINNPIVVNTALGDGSQFGAFRIEAAGSLLTIGGTINANLADVMFEANNSAGQIATVTNTISGNSGLQVLAQIAGGITVTLANTGTANSYAGNTAVSSTNVSSPAATLKLGAANQIPYGAGAGNLLMTNGAFNLNGYSQTLNGLSGSGIVDGVSGTPTLTVGSNNATSTFSGAIKNTGGTLALTKAGTGTLTLSGVNTFGGATTINAGELAGSTVGSCSNSAVTVTAGTNGVQLAAAGGQWFCRALTNYSGTYVDINYNSTTPVSTSVAPLQVLNNLAFTNANVIVRGAGTLAAGDYPLIKYGGTFSGSVTPGNVTATAVGAYYLYNNTANSSIDLVVYSGANAFITWATNNNYWDTTSTNWLDAATPATFANGDNVVLDDSASGSSPILVTNVSAVYPASLTASNSTKSYTIYGSPIAGGATVTVNGTGTLTLSGTNTYSGATTISAGTLKAGSTMAFSTNSAFSIAAGATLNLGGYSNTISSLVTNFTGTITDSSAAGSGGTLTVSTALGSIMNSNYFSGSLGLNIYGGGTVNAILAIATNTYSGGTILGIGSGTTATRWLGSGTIGNGSPGAVTNGVFGTGTITIGAATTDRSQIYCAGGTIINNAIVVNTIQGAADFGAFRLETGPLTINGTINANLSDVGFYAANGVSSRTATVTNTISGNSGLQIQSASVASINGAVFTVVLTNASSANANSYAGNTTIYSTNVNNPAAALTCGAANQIPSGPGKGNLLMTNGIFNLGGFNQTLNGLTGSGIVDGVSGTPTLTVGSNNVSSIFSGVIRNTAGTLALTKVGTGTLNLTNANNTYAGLTTISAGTLALRGSALTTNTASLVVASNAIFDVSGLTSAFTLAQSLSSQTLSNSAPGAIINGTNNCSAGTLSLVYDGVNPAFTITNGGMTLSGSTSIKVTTTAALAPGAASCIITNTTAGTAGAVYGAVPATTATLNGLTTPQAQLAIVNGELWLTNATASTITHTGTTFTYNGVGQTPTISFTGSTGAKTTNYVGTGSTTYSSVNPPTSAGSYYVSNTVAADANYFGTTNSRSFTINQSTSGISYGGTTSFTYNGTAHTPGITGITGSTGARATNYVGTGSTTYSSAVAPLNVGTYALTNTVLSDVNYIGTTNGVTFTIAQTNLTITARTNTKIYDGSASATNTPTITAGNLQTGDVATLMEAYADATVGTGKSLIPSIAITNAGVNVLANYNVTPVNDTTGVINPAQATTSLLLTNSIGLTNYYGQTLVFTAVVQTNSVTAANASSNVVFSLGSSPVWTNAVVGGVAYYTNDEQTVGVTNFTAQYLGDSNYLGSSVTVTQTVLQATPTLTLTASTITYGQTLGSSSLSGSVATNGYDVDADVDAAVAGTFAFANSGIAPNAGSTDVWVVFTPTDTTNYNTASNTVSVTVNKANSSVTVTGTTSFTYDGAGQGPATASVTGSGGALSFSYSGTGYGPTPNAPTNAGSYTVTATVAADPNYNSVSSSPTAFTIGAAPASVTADAKTKTYGAVNPTLTATVVGQVTGGDTINYSLSTTAGQYSHAGVSNILVTLGSNPNYSVLASNGTLTIGQASTFIGASSSENPSGYNDAVIFTATLPTDATGSVVFASTNGAFSTNAVSSGSATSLSITNLPRGTNVITVAYLGDGNYVGSTNTLNQTVTNHPPTVVGEMNVLRTPGEAVLIALSDMATNWSDADGDWVQMTAFNGVTTNGMNLTPLNLTTDGGGYVTTSIAYLGYTNNANVNDRFSYGVGDGYGGTNIGYVNVVVSPFVAGTQTITGQQTTNSITGGSFTVTYYGIPGYTYLLERSTNLTTWVDISTNTIGSGGVANVIDNFSDIPGGHPSSAYYRVGWKTSY